MLNYYILILSLLLGTLASSQCASPPAEFVLETAEDYRLHEDLSFRLMNCLLNSPSEYSDSEIEEATVFCLIWLGGTPDYVVNVNTDAALFLDENPDLLYLFVLASGLVERDFPKYTQTEKEAEALYLVATHEKKSGCKKRCKSLKKAEKLYSKGKLAEEIEKAKNQQK